MAKKEKAKVQKKPMAKKVSTKKKIKKSPSLIGIVHIHSTSNNTIITLTDEKGNTLS
jgi:small subunit ribosomal protein S11